MSFRLTRTACFIQGTWNVYILQPNWLHRHGFLPAEEQVLLQTLTTGPGFRYSAHNQGLLWTVTPTEVTLDTPGSADAVGPLLARLLEVLPHTPLGEVGVTANYLATVAFPTRRPTEPASGETVIAQMSSVLVERADGRYLLDRTNDFENRQDRLSVMATPVVPADGSLSAATAAAFLRATAEQVRIGQQMAARQWQVSFA